MLQPLLDDKYIEKLLSITEHPKLDFKSYWYENDLEDEDHGDTNRKKLKKNELVKDIISICNGSINSLGEYGFLIIGVEEKTKKIIDTQIRDRHGNIRDEQKLKDEITQYIKNYTDKPLSFNIVFWTKDEKNIILIVIEPHPYLISLSKDLEAPITKGKKIYNKGSVLYRENSETDVATSEIREEFEKQLKKIDIQTSKNKLKTLSEQPEVKIEAKDILGLIISSRDIRNLSENKGEKVSNQRVYYEYYTVKRRNSVNGYLFLGKNITKKNVFVSFSQKFANDLPDNLEIFLLKKTIGKKIVEQKEYIYNQLAEYNLANIVGNDVHYIDDIIWDSTMTDDSFNQPYKRDDFIDQKLYKDVEEGEDNNGTLLSEESIKLFLDDLDNDNSSSISVVSGSGGVGKTTFCDTLKYAILREDKIRKKVFYIKGERVVEFSISDSDNKEIRSLDDLYDLYREDTDEFNNISSEDFKLNFIIGNIVVIIDAIEEIESAFKERFNLKLFFKSLKLLHERFLRTKIIVTTREHFVPKIKEIQDELFVSMDYYKLRGFEQSNLEKFLKKKYKSNENKAQEANRFIEDNRLFYDNHIIPLFVDWVCQIIDRPDQNFLPSSKYLIVNESKDKLLINLLQREIKKQSLNVNVDEMFELLESIVIDYNGSMPQEDFSTHVEVLSSQDISNHLKNPLLINENNKVRIRYDILPNLIKSRSLLYSLAGEEELDLDTNKITLILKDCYQGQGEIFNEVVRICKQKKLDMKRIVTRFIRKLKKSFKNETKEIQKENMRKSTSALLHLLNKIQSPSDRSQRMLMIKDVYELAKSNTLSGLYIYGDFEALDFSNVTISDSHFDSYMNFHKSKFPEDSKVVFYHTKFKKFNIPQTQHIKNSHFDSSCIFTDCNIDDITNINLSKENKKIEQLKKDIITLISFIDTSQRSLNLIKQKCSISYSKGIKKLVDILLQKDFLILVEKSTHNQDLYKINQNFYDEIPNIKLGNFPPELEIMLEEIVK